MSDEEKTEFEDENGIRHDQDYNNPVFAVYANN